MPGYVSDYVGSKNKSEDRQIDIANAPISELHQHSDSLTKRWEQLGRDEHLYEPNGTQLTGKQLTPEASNVSEVRTAINHAIITREMGAEVNPGDRAFVMQVGRQALGQEVPRQAGSIDNFHERLVAEMHATRKAGFDANVDRYVGHLKERAAQEGVPITYDKQIAAANVDFVQGRIPKEALGEGVKEDYKFTHSKVQLNGTIETVTIKDHAESHGRPEWRQTRESGVDLNKTETWSQASYLGTSAVLNGQSGIFANSLKRTGNTYPIPDLPPDLKRTLFPHEAAREYSPPEITMSGAKAVAAADLAPHSTTDPINHERTGSMAITSQSDQPKMKTITMKELQEFVAHGAVYGGVRDRLDDYVTAYEAKNTNPSLKEKTEFIQRTYEEEAQKIVSVTIQDPTYSDKAATKALNDWNELATKRAEAGKTISWQADYKASLNRSGVEKPTLDEKLKANGYSHTWGPGNHFSEDQKAKGTHAFDSDKARLYLVYDDKEKVVGWDHQPNPGQPNRTFQKGSDEQSLAEKVAEFKSTSISVAEPKSIKALNDQEIVKEVQALHGQFTHLKEEYKQAAPAEKQAIRQQMEPIVSRENELRSEFTGREPQQKQISQDRVPVDIGYGR